jgi:hypothetical protein
MREEINQPVSIIASFSRTAHGSVVVVPHLMKWDNRRYRLSQMGLYHPERRGTKRVHIFSFLADNVNFRVELDPDTLEWTLMEAYYGT